MSKLNEEQVIIILKNYLETIKISRAGGITNNYDLKDLEEAIKIVIKNLDTYKKLIQEKNKIISEYTEEIEKYCKKDLAFRRRLERDGTTPDLFNQGRFMVCDDILKLLKGGQLKDE